MIHWRLASESPRSFWIDGSATLTTVASRTTMNCAKQTSTRTTQRFAGARVTATPSPTIGLGVAKRAEAASAPHRLQGVVPSLAGLAPFQIAPWPGWIFGPQARAASTGRPAEWTLRLAINARNPQY